MPGKDLCLLSLDGGGIRGLSSLAILKQLMWTIDPKSPPKPCDYFDMIGGTSTGGLMAIMLGRLRMDIDECIAAYAALSDRIFQKKRHLVTINGKVQGRFDTAELELAMKEIVSKKEQDEDALLKNTNSTCKVFVCAVSKETAGKVLFTTYPSRYPPHLFDETRIWEAARATSAASTFFDPITIGPYGEEFIDGAVLSNNPVAELWSQAKFVWSEESLETNVKCVVSIGTGVPSLTPYGSSLLEIGKTLKKIVTETEETAESFHQEHADLDDGHRYFRFNVLHGLERVGLEDATQKNFIMAATGRYLALEAIRKQMKLCGKSLSTREYDGMYRVNLSMQGWSIVNHFVARDEEMEKLESILLPKVIRPMSRKVFVLHGTGGMGKTQMAIEFARRHQKIFSSIFWLNGSSNDQVRRSLVEIARQLPEDQIPQTPRVCSELSPEDLDQIVKNVLHWFNLPGNDQWLLIMDNVDRDFPRQQDPLAFNIEDYFPGADRGSILVTSRLRRLAQYGDSLKLERMNRHQGEAVLELRTGRSMKDLEKLVDHLGGLPLALAQAGSYLRELADVDVSEYIEFYQDAFETLFGCDSSSLVDYPDRSAVSTWTVSYEHVKKKNPLAARMLDLFSHLDYSELWYGLFTPLATEGNVIPTSQLPSWFLSLFRKKIDFIQSIRTLLDYSLIETRVDSVAYSVHPVVHEWCFHASSKIRDDIHIIAILTIGAGCHSKLVPKDWLSQRRLQRHCYRIIRIVDDESRTIEVSNNWVNPINLSYLYLALFWKDQDKLAEAEEMCLRALKGYEKDLGRDHTLTLHVASNLIALYSEQDKLDKAEEMCLQVLKGYEKDLGHDHVLTLPVVSNLAALYSEQGKLDKAEKMFLRVLKGYEKEHLDGDHKSTLIAVNNLGLLYKSKGKLAEAEEMFLRALKGYEKEDLGGDHKLTLTTVNNLVLLYKSQGKLDEAEKMNLRALEGYEKVWGPNHTATLGAVHGLGLLYLDRGKLAEAEWMLRRALKGKEKVWGPDHTTTLDVVHGLGATYGKQGKLADAEAMFLRALKGYEKGRGPDHADTFGVVKNLGLLYKSQGKLDEAEKMNLRALEGYEKVWGPNHMATLGAVHGLGLLYLDRGKPDEAIAMFQRALKGNEKARGPDHTATLDAVHGLGTMYKELGKLTEAEAMFQRALKGNEKFRGPYHKATLGAVQSLGLVYKDQGELTKAEAMFQRALKGNEKFKGYYHKATLGAVQSLGLVYKGRGKLTKAEAMFQRALKGNEKVRGPDHPTTLDAVNGLGAVYSKQGKLAEAEKMKLRALEGYEKIRALDHPTMFDQFNNLGVLYLERGKLDEAEEIFQRALKVNEKARGPDDTDTLEVANNLGLLYMEQDKLSEAEAMFQRTMKGFRKFLGPDHEKTAAMAQILALIHQLKNEIASMPISKQQQLLISSPEALASEHRESSLSG